MTDILDGALRGAWSEPAPAEPSSTRRVMVVGGGGPLGSAVLERLLSTHRFDRVGVVVDQPLTPAMRGLLTLPDGDDAWRDFAADTAVIVFDRERRANGRDDAFVRPLPEQLPQLAGRLRRAGVERLVVAVPHAPSMLPKALEQGLANLDEGAVAAAGFAHLVFLRMAQSGDGAPARGSAPARLGLWMLRQLHWMVPQADQPVRADVVARVVAALALELPRYAPGTRVLPPQWVWRAAQGGEAVDLMRHWLSGQALPPAQAELPRM